MNIADKNLITKAIDALNDQTGADIRIIDITAETKQLVFSKDNSTFQYYFTIYQNKIMALNELQNRDNAFPPLLIAEYINPKLGQQLQKEKIQYIDTFGNAWLEQKSMLIMVRGHKPDRQVPKQTSIKAFKTAGIKLVYAILVDPELLNTTFRKMAETADIALGNIGKILQDLESLNFLINMGKQGKKLNNPKQLLDRWSIAYNEILQPKLFQGAFSSQGLTWQEFNIGPPIAQWGGESGAAVLDQYLKPEITSIYIDKKHQVQFLLQNKLYHDSSGSIKIYHRFWDQNTDTNFVHPILIYADLLASNEQRNYEAARKIYEGYIAKHLGGN